MEDDKTLKISKENTKGKDTRQLVSFDIFDTTLIRKCGSADSIFYLISLKLYPDNASKQNDFFIWRKAVEAKQAKNLHNNMLTLDEIYQDFDERNFNEFTKDQVKTIELETESDNLACNYQIKKEIQAKRQQGYLICFISDMYLPSDFLRGILIREQCCEEDDNIFVSCEHKCSKAEGSLYKRVKEHYGNTITWTHYGDNNMSDIKIPRWMGIKTKKVDTEFTKAEAYLLKQTANHQYYQELRLLIGTQRYARLYHQFPSEDSMNAADFLLPSYIPYLYYIRNIVAKENYQRLYFISRDAYILYRAYTTCLNKKNTDCQYVYFSRKSLAPASLTDLSAEAIAYTLGKESLINTPVKEILSTLGWQKYAQEIPYSIIKDKEDEKKLIMTLLLHQKEIEQELHSQRKATILYMQQIGLFDNCKMAFVDVGWMGSTRRMINSILRRNDGNSIDFIYFGCRNDILSSTSGKYYTFKGDNYKGFSSLVEGFFSLCPNGSTLGYHEEQGKIVPILSDKTYSKNRNLYETNEKTLCTAIRYIANTSEIDFSKVFATWEYLFMDLFNSHQNLINFSTYSTVYMDDKIKLIGKLNLTDIITLLTKGHTTYSTRTNNSIYYTFRINYAYLKKFNLQHLIHVIGKNIYTVKRLLALRDKLNN